MSFSIVIPVYKNKILFLQNLAHNYRFIKRHQIIVVDDASGEDIGGAVRRKYPDITIIENAQNMGFARTVNIGSKQATGDILILLNSDVKIINDFTPELLQQFRSDKDLFAISFIQIEKDKTKVGKNVMEFSRGLPHHNRSENIKAGINAWAEGGSCAIRKDYWNKLGGFNELYSPFYWEDIDLSYRAYGQGWQVIFDPRIIAEHHHESTIKKYFSQLFIKEIAYRNQIIFTWCNIIDSRLIFQHIVFLPYHSIRLLLSGDIGFIVGLFKAFMKIFAVMKIRGELGKVRKLSDQAIFKKLNNNL